MGKNKGRWKKLFLWGGGCLLILTGLRLTIAIPRVDFAQTSWRVDATVAEYKATGWPWVGKDMVRNVPDAENGAKTFDQAQVLFRASGRDSTDLKDAWVAGDKLETEAILKDLKPALDKFVEASRFPQMEFPLDWDSNLGLISSKLAGGKTAARTLGKRAEIRAANEDIDGALSDLRAGFRLSKLLGQEPTVIAMLVESAIASLMLKSVIEVAALHPNDAEWIAQVREEVAGWESGIDLERSLRGDSFLALSYFRDKSSRWDLNRLDLEEESNRTSNPLVEMPNSVGADGIPTSITQRAYLVHYLEAQMEIKRLLEVHQGDPIGFADAFDQYLQKEIVGQTEWSRAATESILTSYMDQTGVTVAKAKYEPRAVEALLRAAEIKARTGSYPGGLREFAAGLKEPTTGGVPGYAVKDGVVTIYWFGWNRRDDGGVRDPEAGKDDFNWEFPPKSRQ